MYGSHDMRLTGFRKLTVVNGSPGNGASHFVGALLNQHDVFPRKQKKEKEKEKYR